jgi:hypothetical protein
MSNTISSTLIQKSIISPYNYPCDDDTISFTVPCQNGDWDTGAKICKGGHNPDQRNCSKIDRNICPKIGSQSHTASFINAPQVQCTYPLSTFQTSNDIQTYIDAFGNDSNIQSTILPNMCSNITTINCPVDPVTGQTMPVCTLFTSTSSEGMMCDTFSDDNPVAANNIKTNVCIGNTTPDCLCQNGAADPLYQDISRNLSVDIPSYCWWKPCTQPNTYVLLSTDLTPDFTLCPADTCDMVRGIIKENKLEEKYGTNVLSVKLSCPLSGNSKSTNSLSAGAIVWLVVIFIVIIGIVIFAVYSGTK